MNMLRTAIITSLTLLATVSVHAAGSDSEPASNVENCKKGEVFDTKQNKCVAEEDTSMNDSERLDNGRALAYAGRFDEAVVVLSKIENRDAEVLNYLGYATRNAGDTDKGIAYYQAALALDPDYTLARSYMGQALLNKGDRRGAQTQLFEIEKRVGTDAREYKLLAVALLQKSLKSTATY